MELHPVEYNLKRLCGKVKILIRNDDSRISTFVIVMRLTITNAKTGGDLLLFKEELEFDRFYYNRDRDNRYFTIAWNVEKSKPLRLMARIAILCLAPFCR